MDVASALRGTNKGNLIYDRRQPTQEFLDKCSPPPAVSCRYSNKTYTNNRLTENSDQKSQPPHRKNSDASSTYDNINNLKNSPLISKSSIEVVSPISTSPREIIPVSPEYTQSVRAVRQYEDSLEKEKKQKVVTKHKEFTEFSKKLQNNAENELVSIERTQLLRAKEKQQETELQFMQQSLELQEKQRQLKEDHRQHAQMLQKKHEKLKEEVKRKEKEKQDRIEKAITLRNDMGTILDKLKNMYDQFSQKERLPDSVKKGIDLVNTKYGQATQIASGDVEIGELNKLTEMLKLCLNAHDFIKKDCDELTKKIKEETLKAEAEKKASEEALAKARAEEAAKSAAVTQVQQTPGLATGPLASSTPAPAGASAIAKDELKCVDEEAFTQYTKLQDQLKKAEEESKALFHNAQMKKMKFDIQKSVNTPINNVSAVSGDHLRDKLQRLTSLLSGQTVDLSGKRFSLSACPQALPFCKYLIAKMIVKKGEEMVSAKHSSAFAIAALTVGLITEHPDILPLLLGHFNLTCPYTVPYHKTKAEGQTNDDYWKALGYKYDLDGEAEKQDQFLKRMSGIMRLYSSIMVSHPPRGPNPYGIEHAWAWLSMVMNIEPLPDVTATMTFDLLEVTGHALFREYRKQFVKLLHVLIKEFLPKLKNVASPSGGGPMTRLEDFLQTSVQHNGNIPPPEGLLNARFWMS